jgi:uncharacterized membrane protein YcjF (UPF0283 family)
MGLVSAAGLGWLPFVMWLPALLPLSLGITAVLLVRNAVRSRTYTSLLLGCGASALVIAVSRGLVPPAWIALAVLTLVASVRNARRCAVADAHPALFERDGIEPPVNHRPATITDC